MGEHLEGLSGEFAMMTHAEETCINCRYWSPEDSLRISGECRRRAPTAGRADEDSRFPVTTEDEWCGGFEAQKQPWCKTLKPAQAG